MTLPAGKYWVGDLCYVMHEVWDEFCNRLEPGKYTLKDGRKYAWENTAWGDGCFQDGQGRNYGVDAGLIGCILLSDINFDDGENDTGGGHVIEFDEAFDIYYDGGRICIGHIMIDTDPEPEDEDYE